MRKRLRVAKARGVSQEQVNRLIAQQSTEQPDLGLQGEQRVNALKLNRILDSQLSGE